VARELSFVVLMRMDLGETRATMVEDMCRRRSNIGIIWIRIMTQICALSPMFVFVVKDLRNEMIAGQEEPKTIMYA